MEQENVLKAQAKANKRTKVDVRQSRVLCTFTDISHFFFVVGGGRRRWWRIKVLFSIARLFIYLFIIFNRATKYACSFMNSLFHLEYFVCSRRTGEMERNWKYCTHIQRYTQIHHSCLCLYTFENVLFYSYIWIEWLAGRLPNCVGMTWAWFGLLWFWIWRGKRSMRYVQEMK